MDVCSGLVKKYAGDRIAGLAFDATGKLYIRIVNKAKGAKERLIELSDSMAKKLRQRVNAEAAKGTAEARQLKKMLDNTQCPLPKGFDPLKGFKSFDDFKAAVGKADNDHAWHHVVEQTINSGKFAPELLHNPANLFKLPHGSGSIHERISGFYSSKPPFAEGLRVRDWLSKKSFMEQFEFGINKIKEFGGSQYLPPELR